MATLNVGFGNQTLKLKFKAPPSFAAAGEEPSSSVSLTLVPTEQGGKKKLREQGKRVNKAEDGERDYAEKEWELATALINKLLSHYG